MEDERLTAAELEYFKELELIDKQLNDRLKRPTKASKKTKKNRSKNKAARKARKRK